MSEGLRQGDILKLERIKHSVLVVSKDFFNLSGEIIGCPIFVNSMESPLHIYIEASEIKGYVQCEKMMLFDLTVRGYKRVDRAGLGDVINITDAIQGIFDYI